MPSDAWLSILRLPNSYLFQLQLPGARQHATTLVAAQPLPDGQSVLPQQIGETIRLLNRLIAQRQSHHSIKAGAPPAAKPATDLLQSLGRLLYNQLVPAVIQQGLRSLPAGTPLLVSTNHSDLPWELLHDGEQFLASKHLVGRQMWVDTLPRPFTLHPQRLRRALLIGNPTGDLPQAEQEIEELLALLDTIPDMAVPVVLMGARAGKDAILRQLVSGDYDLIHYSGHAFFAPAHPQATGLVLARDEILTATAIKENLSGQPLVFLNGCESARSTSQAALTKPEHDLAYLGLGIEGLAAAFLQGGAQNFVGTIWPIADAGSQTFALAFHRAALQGETVGAALRQARQTLADAADPLWASYVLYGDPSLTIAPPAARAQPATVLVMRLCGLAGLLAATTPEAAAQEVAAYLHMLSQAILRCGGQIYNMAHDTYIALFGIPQTQENDAERALYATLDMQTAIIRTEAETRPTQLTHSIGVATGDVLVDTLPNGSIPFPLITGPAVEAAVRLAAQASPGEILVAESARRLVRHRFQLESQIEQRPGQDGVYRLAGTWPITDPFWPLPGHQGAMIGRQTELAALQEAWQRSRQGQGQVVDVVGEAGVGKSRLVQAFHQSVGQEAHWLVAVCPSAYVVGAYWLIGQLVRALLGVAATADQALLRSKLQQELEQHGPESVAVVGDVLGVDYPAGGVPRLDQQTYQRQLLTILEKWLLEQAATMPLVIVLEDLHRADDPSLTILKQLLARLDRAPVLVIALFRQTGDWQSPWRQRRNHRLVPVKALNAEEGRQLVAALLQTTDVTEQIAQLVLAPAEGNPFFVHELVLSLREAQVLRLEQGTWQLVRAFRQQDIPDSLDRLIRLRMNSASEAAQSVLALLAVAGDSCEYPMLAHALAGDSAEPWLDSSLDQLVDQDLISQRWEQDRQVCRFPHALIQSVVYESLRSEERRRYHRRIWLALEQLYQGRTADVSELMAHHSYRSVTLPGILGGPAHVVTEVSQADLTRTARYLEQSGAQANRRYAAHQAIQYYQQALQVSQALASDPDLLQATCSQGIGDAYDLLGDYGQAIAAYRAAFSALQKQAMTAEARRWAADLLRRIGRLHGWLSQFTEAHAQMQQALQILADGHDQADRAAAALIHTHTGSLYYLQGQLEPATQACQQALTLVDEQTNAEVAATAFNVFGVICEVTGQWTQAVTFYERSRDIWARLDRRHQLSQVLDNLGTLNFYRGDFALAEQHYRQNLDFWQAMEARDNAGYAVLNLGSVYLHRGQVAQAESYYNQALDAFQETNNHKLAALTHNNLGLLELSRENNEVALNYFQQSIAEDPSAENYRGLSEAEQNLGNIDQALAHAQHSLDLARESSMAFEEGVTLRRLGCIYLACGNRAKARTQFDKSLLSLRTLGARFEMAQTLVQLAILDGHPVTDPELRNCLSEAITIFEEVGAHAHVARARRLLDVL